MTPGLPFDPAEPCLGNGSLAELTLVNARSGGPRIGGHDKTRRTSPLARDGKDG